MNDFNQRMKQTLNVAQKMAAERDITLSLFVEDLKSGGSIQFQEELVHSGASTIKTPLMMAVLEEEGRGFTFSDLVELSETNKVDSSVVTQIGEGKYTISEYLQWMMLESCNASTNVLIDLVGYERVNRIFDELHMPGSILQRKMMDVEARARGVDNTTTAKDMASLLRTIYRREYFKEASCEAAIALMKRCRDARLLKRFLPQDLPFAHKTGGLDEVSHDTGIFFGKDRDVLMCALTTSVSGSEIKLLREQTIGHIGRWLLKEEI